jgi:squalene synthase HpnC
MHKPAPPPAQTASTRHSNRPHDAAITHYENFPVASFLCPAHLRAPIAAIYHFARTADDIADEGNATAGERLQDLARYRSQLALAADYKLDAAAEFDPRWAPVFSALQRALQSYPLPVELFHDLLDAFVQDIEKTRDLAGYADDAELLDYCRRSANPIGRLLLSLYGVTDAQSLEQSDAICTALQLINFWQDPSVDLPRGRRYFTREMQTQSDVDENDLLACRQTPAVTRMVEQCVHTARATMLRGAPLVHAVPGRAGWELRLVVQGGMRILDRIEALRFATLRKRPTLHATDYGVMLWRALWM